MTTELMQALGFKKPAVGLGWSLRVNRLDGRMLCDVHVKDGSWDGCVVWWARDDMRGASDAYIRATTFPEFMQQLLLWAIERGRGDMQAEALNLILDCQRRVDRIAARPSNDSLKSARERDDDARSEGI